MNLKYHLTVSGLRSVPRAFALLSCSAVVAFAQVAPGSSPATDKKDHYELPAFEVNSSKDQGYFAKKSVSGMKTSQDLFDTAANISVVPRDLIDDVGMPESASDTLKFTTSGVNPYVRGEQMQIRGQRVGFSQVDDIPDLSFFADNAGIDTYEVLKGPQALLYGTNAGIFGLVIKTTKKPLPVFQTNITASVGDYGWRRTDLDITGPLAKGFSYRVVAAYQNSDGLSSAYRDDRRVANSTLQWTDGRTTLRASYDWHQIELGVRDLNNVFDDRGPIVKQYDSPFGKNFHYGPDWGTAGLYFNDVRLTGTHQWNENWQTKVYYQRERGDRPHMNRTIVNQVDLVNNVITLDYMDYDENFISSAYGTDNIGKYKLGKVDLQTNFGYLRTTRRGGSKTYVYITDYITTSLTDPIDFSTIAIPPSARSKPAPTNVAGTAETYYLLETASFLDDRLILSGGISHVKATNSQSPQDNTSDNPKRGSIVVKPLKNVSLYYGYATMFSPTSATTTDINGKRLPNQHGKGNEVGLKASFLDGRLTATVDYYWLNLSNVATPAGVTYDGTDYYILSPSRKYTGYEADLQLQITKNWQLTAVAWTGETLDTDGKRASNTLNESAGFYTRYNFTEGVLKKFNVGGGAYFSGNRYFRGGHSFDAYTVANVFIGYKQNENLSYTLHVNNVFDEQYVAGAWNTSDADIGDPRMIRLSVKYTFK